MRTGCRRRARKPSARKLADSTGSGHQPADAGLQQRPAVAPRAVDSVFAQIHSNDASTAPHIARFVKELAAQDGRVSIKRLAVNRGHLRWFEEALALATGEYVA